MSLDGPEGTVVLMLVTCVAEEELDSWLAVDTGNLGFLFSAHLTLWHALVPFFRRIPFCPSDVSNDFKDSIVDWDLSDVRDGDRVLNAADGAPHSLAHHYLEEAF